MNSKMAKDELRREIVKGLEGETLGLMLYGSVARGSAGPKSDVDVLQLTRGKQRGYRIGNYNYSVYTSDFLKEIAAQGSLFMLHLQTDGVILSDPFGMLGDCLACYVPPVDYEPFRVRLRSAVQLLHTDNESYRVKWRQFGRLALFFLRSSIFAKSAEDGQPDFSVEQIALRWRDSRLQFAYNIKHLTSPDWEYFCFVTELVKEYLKCDITSSYRSLEDMILGNSENELLVSLAFRLARGNEATDFYTSIREKLAQRSGAKALPSDANAVTSRASLGV